MYPGTSTTKRDQCDFISAVPVSSFPMAKQQLALLRVGTRTWAKPDSKAEDLENLPRMRALGH